MGTTSNVLFNGNSRYSQDFQSLIDRAVSIASLPIAQLKTQRTQLTNESTALSSLDTKYQALLSAIQGLANALEGSSFLADISDPDKLSASLGAGAMEGTYSVHIVDDGAYATSLSTTTWDSSGTHTYELSLNGTRYSLSAAGSSAESVAAAINAHYGDQVRATVVNVGTGETPDYRISLQGVQLGDLQPDILEDSSGVQTQQVTGVPASYIVNNSGVTVNSSSRTISVADGVTLTMLGGTGSVDVTVTRSAAAISAALSTFTSAYNSAASALDAQRGEDAGALSGDPVISALSSVLRDIVTYSHASGSIGSLAALGFDLGTDGQLTFDSSAFQTAYSENGAGITSFFGSMSTSGFLRTTGDSLDTAVDETTGLLAAAEATVQSQITDTTDRIDERQARVDQLEQQLQEQMAAADALIASMEQQYSYVTGMFEAMRVASEQYR